MGAANGYFECYIPSDVLYRMNTDTVLRQKVYDMLADYSSDKFKLTMQTLNPPVKNVHWFLMIMERELPH